MRRKRKKKWLRKILLILLLIILVIGGRYAYMLKKQVEAVTQWEDLVNQITTDYGIENYRQVVLAIIFTETKGDHLDLMQSSESKYGAQNKITSSEESVKQGVQHLTEVLETGQNQAVDIWTVVQAYNFGGNYISYVAENGGKNTIDLAESYSKDYLAPLLGNQTGATYAYNTPVSLKNNRRYLYKDGGNFLYAEVVRYNLVVMEFFKGLPF